nr:NUDIX hydrolase [Ornithinimicrobium sp. F0845]
MDIVASPHEPLASAGASVVLVTDPSAAMVLVQSVGRSGWAPPGGKRDPGETPRSSAVREVAEETGLHLDPGLLVPVGYERITLAGGHAVAPWVAGDNHIAVFGTRVERRLPVGPRAADVVAAEWVGRPELLARCAAEPWWPLVERYLSGP